MSLVVTVFVPTGIVMAADSRTVIQSSSSRQLPNGTSETVHTPLVLSDSSYKLFALANSGVGILTHGDAILRDLPVESFVKGFAEQHDRPHHSIEEMAGLLHEYFRANAAENRALFIVAGYGESAGNSVPHVYTVDPASTEGMRRANVDKDGRLQYGVLRGGDTGVVDRLISPDSLPPYHLMPLPDAVDYARYLIETTTLTQRFEPRFPSVGGPVDLLSITADSMRFVQRKGQTAGNEIVRYAKRKSLDA